MPHIYTVEYYSAIRKNEVMPFAATRMDLESVILSEVSQTEEEMPCNIPYMWSQRRNDANELNLQNRKRLTDLEDELNALPEGKDGGMGSLGSLGWTCTHCHIQNG